MPIRRKLWPNPRLWSRFVQFWPNPARIGRIRAESGLPRRFLRNCWTTSWRLCGDQVSRMSRKPPHTMDAHDLPPFHPALVTESKPTSMRGSTQAWPRSRGKRSRRPPTRPIHMPNACALESSRQRDRASAMKTVFPTVGQPQRRGQTQRQPNTRTTPVHNQGASIRNVRARAPLERRPMCAPMAANATLVNPTLRGEHFVSHPREARLSAACVWDV